MKKLVLLLLIILNGIVSGQSLKPTDTICLTLPEAKLLAYYKVNYFKLDSLTRMQAQIIELLNKSIESKQKIIDIAELRIANFQKQINLINAKHEKELQIYKHKKTFWQKIKPYAYGFASGIIVCSIAGKPP